jgi:anthranilate synthase component 2
LPRRCHPELVSGSKLKIYNMKKILVLDNYDSFTYNLVHYIESFNVHCDVFRNDKISLEDVNQYDKIILSPGPGIPEEAGILLDVIKIYAPTKSILGVCLGHQAIGQVFGAELYNVGNVIHGKSKNTKVIEQDIFVRRNGKRISKRTLSFMGNKKRTFTIDNYSNRRR